VNKNVLSQERVSLKRYGGEFRKKRKEKKGFIMFNVESGRQFNLSKLLN